MNALSLARWQFALTTIYHFIFVPLTLGLSILLAILETKYVTSGDETYKRMVKFWGRIFLINFALGVVSGLVQEFQFGLNWSEYSRFMGDIFGAPLAIEALLAFYLESTFIGVWHFGWDKIPAKMHAAAMWLVAIGSNISALWILIANSFMQNPVGYAIRNGRAEMTDFWALVGNANVWHQFPHVLAAGITGAGFLVMAFSAYHLLKGKDASREFFRKSFRWAATYALIGTVLVGVIGHFQGQFLIKKQPIKMMAAEAIWETEQPAAFSVVAAIDQEGQRNTFDLRIPYMLSFLSYNDFTSKVEGIKPLQAAAEAEYGPGDYIPPVALTYWSFRIMVGVGTLMVLLAFLGVFFARTGKLESQPWYLKIMMPAALLPTLASTTGWLLAETGRWPWIVFGLQKIEDAVSPNVGVGAIWFSLIAINALYLVLLGVGVALALKYGKQDPLAEAQAEPVVESAQAAA